MLKKYTYFSILVHILLKRIDDGYRKDRLLRKTAELPQTILRKEKSMARGQRKTLEEKIAAKLELIEALTTRLESEQRELEEMYQEKKRKELEVVSDIIEEAGLEPEEVAEVLQQYLERREEAAS